LGGDTVAGGKMKETGYSHWNSPNTGATNETGFSALPGGLRDNGGNFNSYGYDAGFWSSDEYNLLEAWCHVLSYNSVSIFSLKDEENKKFGSSVRLVKD
jgi:uncharacterized protein (TIGR02145 family)